MTRPTDAAIAQAFREVQADTSGFLYQSEFCNLVQDRARELDATYRPRINSGEVDNGLDTRQGVEEMARNIHAAPARTKAELLRDFTPPAQAAEAVEERVMVAIMELGLHDCATEDVRRMAGAAIAAMQAGE